MSRAVNVSHLATDDWQHAMVSGNGRQGVLCYGGPARPAPDPVARAALPAGGRAAGATAHRGRSCPSCASSACAGRFAEAADAVVDLAVAGDARYAQLRQADPFVGAGTLTVALPDRPGAVTGWRREVDFATGVVRQTWTDGAGPVSLEVFVSRPHDVVVVRLRGEPDRAGDPGPDRRRAPGTASSSPGRSGSA